MVVTQERPLELDPQTIAPECIEQAPEAELVVDAALRAATEADQPFGVLEHIGQRDEWL
jgi:hypothetical protein